MHIQLNGERRELAGPASIAELLATLGIVERRVAVELNGRVVPRSEHAQRRLDEGDRVELISAIGGG